MVDMFLQSVVVYEGCGIFCAVPKAIGESMANMLDILIVEYLTERITFFIERFGHHHLHITENTEDAIAYLDDNLYDCIFLGGELGKHGGYASTVAKFLSQNPGNPNCNAEIIVHAWDTVEADDMIRLLPQAKRLPFSEVQFSTFDF